MYQNCCKKCGSTSLYTKNSGNNVGLYCSDCGAWIKWLGKDELRAFEHSKEEKCAEIYTLNPMEIQELAKAMMCRGVEYEVAKQIIADFHKRMNDFK